MWVAGVSLFLQCWTWTLLLTYIYEPTHDAAYCTHLHVQLPAWHLIPVAGWGLSLCVVPAARGWNIHIDVLKPPSCCHICHIDSCCVLLGDLKRPGIQYVCVLRGGSSRTGIWPQFPPWPTWSHWLTQCAVTDEPLLTLWSYIKSSYNGGGNDRESSLLKYLSYMYVIQSFYIIVTTTLKQSQLALWPPSTRYSLTCDLHLDHQHNDIWSQAFLQQRDIWTLVL